MIPNTTQTPNNLFNGEMAKMKDTELRVVLLVTRKTLGWILNPETGTRKKEDWISRGQLMKMAKRGHNAVSKAVDVCVRNQWIEARNEVGEMLDTPEKRQQLGRGGKIYYRLGQVFMGNLLSSKRTAKKGYLKEDTTKVNRSTKETYLQKDKNLLGGLYPDANEVIAKKMAKVGKRSNKTQTTKV